MNTLTLPPHSKKILFASFPADGHFNPLTGLAMHLKQAGYDVRWYASKTYTGKLKKLQIKHYPFRKAVDVSNHNFDEVFPGRTKYRTQAGRLRFDLIHAFILRGPEYAADIADIYTAFPFDLMIADCTFTGIPFVKDVMKIPVVSIGVLPLMGSSRDLPPNGLGLTPSSSQLGKLKQHILRMIANRVIFRKPNKILQQLLNKYGIPHQGENIFDMLINKASLFLQTGTPGFEYFRGDLGRHIHFIGPLLPYENQEQPEQWFDERLNRYKRVVLVTQGTVEKDTQKLLVPVLEAFKESSTLVVATTGGSNTAVLRKAYPQQNIIIEDFIPFNDVMPYADAYVSNGGYGGVMMSIENNLPMVVAGVHEGKNEICARVGYFKLGINLKTERPVPQQLRKAVDAITSNEVYRRNVHRLSGQFLRYQPAKLVTWHIEKLLAIHKARQPEYANPEELVY